ncbi:cytochrome P450 [Aspergillus ellipticus CBS 707.79]|uniref:Cytochrome P450 n=1 Tax=Aspergillus ellipticus CBS 707.79 TaxID=1448320 RepID=A0A319DWV5_9EURO|nr:cytochrome P450 [Aspergillus ellipticus CBS 707.79]
MTWKTSLSRLSTSFAFAALCLTFFYVASTLICKRKQVNLPPDPAPLPIIGNIHQLPPAEDLLRKRGNLYNSRPRLAVVGECFTKGMSSVLIPYGNQWRAHNRIFLSLLGGHLESKQLLFDLLAGSMDSREDESSEFEFSAHIHRLTCSVMSSLIYGRRLKSFDMEDVAKVDEHVKEFSHEGNRSETQLAEMFPVLNYLPSWLAPWKRRGDEIHAKTVDYFEKNVAIGKKNAPWNFTHQADRLRNGGALHDIYEMPNTEMAYFLGHMQGAGSETTTVILRLFVLACVLHPSKIQTAQHEIDRVVGMRLPSFDDASRLPHVNALINEFKPERWLESPDLPSYSFGLGRRFCPGKHLAQGTLFITISRLLWAYNITHASRGGHKVEVDPWVMVQGLAAPPLPFEAAFRVRSKRHREIIQSEWENAEKDLDKIISLS